MERTIGLYGKLFKSTFYLSAFTFGGGYVIVPLMRKKFVEEYQWIEEQEMMDLIALAQSSPGAMAVNASILIGYRMGGVLGALVTVIGTVLPPFLIITIVSKFYEVFQTNWFVKTLLIGMRSGVAAVIVDVILKMGLAVIKEKKALSVVVMIGAFIASYIFHISIAICLVVCAIIGVFSYYYYQQKERKEAAE